MDVESDVVTFVKEGPWIRTTLKPGRPAPLPSRNSSGLGAKQVRHRMIVVVFIMAMREEVPAYASSRTLMLNPRRMALAHSRALMLYTEVDVMSESGAH